MLTFFSFLRSILQGSARMISDTNKALRLVSLTSTSIRNEISNQLVDYLKYVLLMLSTVVVALSMKYEHFEIKLLFCFITFY